MARPRAASFALMLLTLLAVWITLANAQSASPSSTDSSTTTSSSSSRSSSSSSSSSTTTAQSSSRNGDGSIVTFSTTFRAFPTGTLTTRLPIPSAQPTPWVPITNNQVLGEKLSFILNAADEQFGTICWYPISGNYGLLPRVLFYTTLIAALILRHHQWLYAGALVASLTYSGSAAIHACILAWSREKNGDLDVFPLLTILGLSGVMAVPLLNWSDTLRNIGRNANEVRRGIAYGPESCRNNHHGEPREQEFKRAARTILLYWSLLVGVGFISIFATIEDKRPQSWHINTYSGVNQLICTPANGTIDYSAGQSDALNGAVLTQEFVDANNCQNPCSRSYDGSVPIFRNPSDLMPLTIHQLLRGYNSVESNSTERSNDLFIGGYLSIGLFMLLYVFLQGGYAILFGRRTPGQARNLVYALLTRTRLSKARSPLDPASKGQRGFAKAVGLMSYAWAVFVFVLSIPAVIVVIVAGEIIMFYLPQNEQPYQVGQWMSFTSLGLALLAAFFARYNDDILYMVTLTCYKVAWLLAHPAWLCQCFQPRRGGPKGSAKNIFTGEMGDMPDQGLYRRAAGVVLQSTSVTVGTYVNKRVHDSRSAIVGEWRQLVEFWKDPEQSRANQGGVLHASVEPCQCAWGCSCSSIQVQGKCRHEERTCLQGRRDYEACEHIPKCQHTRQCAKARRRNVRLRALHPERRTIAMALGPIHADMLQVDMTKTPIPFRGAVMPAAVTRATQKYVPAPEGSESEMDEKLDNTGFVPHMTQDWEATQRNHSLPSSGSLKRIFSKKSRTSNPSRPSMMSKEPSRPSMRSKEPSRPSPVSKPSDESKELVQPTVRDASFDSIQASVHSHGKGGGVVVNESAIHPTMRDSFISDDSNAIPYVHHRHPNRDAPISEAELSRRRSMLKNLPEIPSPGAPRPPNTTPNQDTRSMVSGVSALSPVGMTFSRNSMMDRPDDVSPEATLHSSSGLHSSGPHSSGPHSSTGQQSKIASPASNVEDGSDEGQEYSRTREQAGLASSFERGIMGRHRRSQVYGTDLGRSSREGNRNVTEGAPIPISIKAEEDTTSDDDGTLDDKAGHGQITPRPHHRRLRDDSTEPDETEDDIASESAPSEHPAPPRRRHIAELVQFLPGPRESTGTFLTAHEKHKLLDPPSGSSTPPIQLPALSPPDPSSNAALAGNLVLLDRSPHLSLGSLMYTPDRLSGSSLLRVGIPAPGTEVTSAPRSAEATLDGIARIQQAVERQDTGSPRPPGWRSTVDYLQVHRPTSMDYGDEIVLRKDEFGQYQIVANDKEIIDPTESEQGEERKRRRKEEQKRPATATGV